MLLLLMSAVALTSAAPKFTYTLTDLGVDVYPYAINSSGHTAGKVPGANNRAFFHDGTTLSLIPLLTNGTENEARGLDDNDVVAGWCRVTGTGEKAFRYNVGTTALDVISISGSPTWGLGINNSGTITGWSPAHQKAFIWTTAPAVTFITAPNPTGIATYGAAINSSGQVAGSAKFALGGLNLALRFTPPSTLTQAGTAGEASVGLAINSSGNMAGTVNCGEPGLTPGPLGLGVGGTEKAFYWNGTTMTRFGGLGSRALGINSSNVVVGTDTNGAFVYSGGTLTDLNTLVSLSPGWQLLVATAINDSGQITGYGIRPKAGGGMEEFGFILS
jgi:hypothetical protein